MKHIIKLILLCFLILLVVFTFTACKINVNIFTETTEGSNINETSMETPTYITPETTEVQTYEPQTTLPQIVSTTSSSIVTKQIPSNTPEYINAYNSALTSGVLKCTFSSQKVSAGKMWIVGKENETMDLLAPEQAELLKKFEKTENTGASLERLENTDVLSATASGNVVTYQLTERTIENTAPAVIGGYYNIIGDTRVPEIASGVLDFANLKGSVNIKSTAYKLYDGQLIVCFNSDFSKIESVKFIGKQNFNAQMSYLFLNINVDIDYNISSDYTK